MQVFCRIFLIFFFIFINSQNIFAEEETPQKHIFQAPLKKNISINLNNLKKTKNFSKKFCYISIIFLSSLCILAIYKRKKLLKKKSNISETNFFMQKPSQTNYIPENITYINIPVEETKQIEPTQKTSPEKEKNILSNIIESNKIQNLPKIKDDDIDTIIDDITRVVFNKNDLMLFPGVPELPGLESKKTDSQFNFLYPENGKIYFPDNISTTEKYKNDELSKETDETINLLKDIFFDNISSIQNIPTQSNEIKITFPKAGKNQNILIDTFKINEKICFELQQNKDNILFCGKIENKVFNLKTFTKSEVNNEKLYMEFCNKTKRYSIYSVILNNFKALIKVSEDEISLIGEYN